MKAEVINSFKWSLIIQLANQATQFGVSLILARILFPEDFGLMGMISIFIAVGNLITDGGLGQSLIRTKELNDEDYSTVFIFSLITAIIIYLSIFLLAPSISAFFNEPLLTQILRIYGISIVITALSTVQSIKLNKALQFRTQFYLLLPSILISSIIAIWMAMEDYGVWSLVVKELVFSSLFTIQLWLYSGWLPLSNFNRIKFKNHFGFSSKLLIIGIINQFFSNSYNLIIGKVYSTTQLGLFTRSKSISLLPGDFVFNSVNRVVYPLLSKINDQDHELKCTYRRIASLFAFIIIPISIVIIIFAKYFILFLLTDKWIEAVPFLQMLMLAAMFDPFQKLLLNIIKVKGNSGLILRLSILEYTLLGIGIILTYQLSITIMIGALVLVSVIKYLVTSKYAGGLIGYSIKEQLIDIYKPFLFSLVAGFLVYLLLNKISYLISLSIGSGLIIGLICFCIIYFIQGKLFKSAAQKLLFNYVGNYFSKISIYH